MADLFAPSAGWAIAAMALATYLCRVSGYFAMNLIPLTPRLRRGLAALPGSIIIAAVVPAAERGGLAAAVALAAGLVTMLVVRHELAALMVGLGVAALMRMQGL